MRFWDSSAVVPLLLTESGSNAALQILSDRNDITVWWGTPIECVAAITRAERDARIDTVAVPDAVAALRLLRSSWVEVDATARLREIAERLVRVHPLRAADAMQLAAAGVACDGQPSTLQFVTLDDRLAQAADREGFPVLMPGRA